MASVIRFPRQTNCLLRGDRGPGSNFQHVLNYFHHTTLPRGGDRFDQMTARLLVARCYFATPLEPQARQHLRTQGPEQDSGA